LEQSFDLQSALEKLDPESLSEAFKDARSMGPGWKRRVDAGQNAMRRLFGRAFFGLALKNDTAVDYD
jgi:hypothetical protein